MSSQARSKYDNVAIGLHWLTAALVVFMLVFGEELIDATDNGSTFGPSLHISIGSAIFVLTILRLLWRVSHPPPSYPAGMAWWEKLAAKVTHLAFYVLLFVLPISGWLIQQLDSTHLPKIPKHFASQLHSRGECKRGW